MNTNFQTIHQMGTAISNFVKQATGRENVQNIEMDHVTVAQNHVYDEVDVSGRVVQFSAGEAGLAFEKLLVQIEPVQDLHGYDHPWPAGGGANKLRINADGFNFTTWVEYNQTTEKFTIKQGTGVVPGAIPVNEIIPAGTDITVSVYIESGMYTSGDIYVGGYHTGDANFWQGQIYLPINVDLTNKIYTQAVTTTEELNAFELFIYGNPTVTSNIVFRAQIELGTNNSSSWHPYSNICPITGWTMVNVYQAGQSLEDVRTFRFTFPSKAGIVYGGTLDVTTGTLVVDRASVDLGKLAWSNDPNRPTVKFSSSLRNSILKTSPWANALCSEYALNKTGPGELNDGQFSTTNNYGAGYIFFKDSAFSGKTAEEVKEYLTGVQLVYELATPITYTLTPQEITTLLGQNNIWADTGDIEVKFTNLKELY